MLLVFYVRVRNSLLMIYNICYIQTVEPTIEFIVPVEPVRLSSGIPLDCTVPRAKPNVKMVVSVLGVEQQEDTVGRIQANETYTAHINTTLMVNMRTPQVTVVCVVVWKNKTLSERKNVTLNCE